MCAGMSCTSPLRVQSAAPGGGDQRPPQSSLGGASRIAPQTGGGGVISLVTWEISNLQNSTENYLVATLGGWRGLGQPRLARLRTFSAWLRRAPCPNFINPLSANTTASALAIIHSARSILTSSRTSAEAHLNGASACR